MKAYVKHDFRLSSTIQAQHKLDENYNKELYNYNKRYGKNNSSQNNNNNSNNNNNNSNEHVWDGKNNKLFDNIPPPPKRKVINEMSYLEKIDDRSGAVLYVSDPNGKNQVQYECKYGRIDFRKSTRNCNSIEILLDPKASAFQDPKWKETFTQSFYNWQFNRKDKEINFKFEFLKDTTLEIIEPSKPMSYAIVYPAHFLGDKGGDQFDLKNRMTHALEAHNYRNRNDENYTPIDVSQMYGISRSTTKTPELAQKSWNRWRQTQLGQSYPKMNQQSQKYYRDKYYHNYLYSNIIIMKFENEQLDMPPYLQFQFYNCKVTGLDHSLNDIENFSNVIIVDQLNVVKDTVKNLTF